MTLEKYCISLINEIPHEVYAMALIVFCLGFIIAILAKGIKEGFRWSAALLLVEYIFLVLGSTVLFRHSMPVQKYDFKPFWSYAAICSGDDSDLLPENIMNVVVFVPIGLLAGCVLRKGNWKIALLIGLGMSVCIEAMQFIFMKGFSELDDVMHNTLGCMIGYGMFVLINRFLRYE